MSYHNHETDEYNKRFGVAERKDAEEKKEDGMIAKHLEKIKQLGFYYELVHLLKLQRERCLESIMNTDFYRKHKNDFPKSFILDAPEPEELEQWKEFKPKDQCQSTPA